MSLNNHTIKFLTIYLLGALALLLCLSCQKQSPEISQSVPPETITKPVDYVLLVDNSASIKGYERTIVREAIKLFIDLADSNDRISLVSFGKQAATTGPVLITGKESKKSLQDDVERTIDFSQQYSDIRAGLQLLAQSKEALYRSTGSLRSAILFSDGLLETASGSEAEALKQIVELKDRQIQDIIFFCIGLGKESMDRVIKGTGTMTGRGLLSEIIAGRSGRFKPINTISELAGNFVDILKQTKQLPDVFDKPTRYFHLDSAISMTAIIIPKRDDNGKRLFEDAALEITPPSSEPVNVFNRNNQTAIEWTGNYESLELIKVKRPSPGVWSVTIKDGQTPNFHIIVHTNLELRADVAPCYFSNQRIVFQPFIYDRLKKATSPRKFSFLAFVNSAQVAAQPDGNGNMQILLASPPPGNCEIRFQATDTADKDFFRLSPEYRTSIVAPVFSFELPLAGKYPLLPFVSLPIHFGVKLTNAQYSIASPSINISFRAKAKHAGQSQSVPLVQNGGFYGLQFKPNKGGEQYAHITFMLKGPDGREYPVESSEVRLDVIDLRVIAWILALLALAVIILFIRATTIRFAFTAVVKQGEKKKKVPSEACRTYKFSVKDLHDIQGVKIKLYAVKGLLMSSRMPWMEISAPVATTITVDGNEWTGSGKAYPGMRVRIAFKPDPLIIEFPEIG